MIISQLRHHLPILPIMSPPQFVSRPGDVSDDDEAGSSKGHGQDHSPRKRTAYDSRIQQLLFENPELDIVIADAGKSSDGGYIVYRIRTAVCLGGL